MDLAIGSIIGKFFSERLTVLAGYRDRKPIKAGANYSQTFSSRTNEGRKLMMVHLENGR